jgi:hypothetical protein
VIRWAAVSATIVLAVALGACGGSAVPTPSPIIIDNWLSEPVFVSTSLIESTGDDTEIAACGGSVTIAGPPVNPTSGTGNWSLFLLVAVAPGANQLSPIWSRGAEAVGGIVRIEVRPGGVTELAARETPGPAPTCAPWPRDGGRIGPAPVDAILQLGA